jgi:hypothetical protein
MSTQAKNSSYRGSVPFESSDDPIEIAIVVVPPNGAAIAYGHDSKGHCVTIRGDRAPMLALFHRLRESSRQNGKLTASGKALGEVTRIERDECPTHLLPEIPIGSAVAWAPY